ncbi:alpha/beta hydrolase family protein [Paenibacillus albiflavus]|nr:carboxylic ester hydrolase [Paenibacillus albiflavus]
MRMMEIIVIVVNFLFLGRLLFFSRGLSIGNVILLGASVVVTALQILLEGYRWQMIPAYLVLLVLSLQVFIYPNKYTVSASMVKRIFKGCLSVVYLIVAVALPFLLPIFSFDKPTGPYEVGTTTFHFIDSERREEYSDDPKDRRELMVQLWYPASGSNEPMAPYTTSPKELARGLASMISIPAFTIEHFGQVKTHSHQEALLSGEEKTWPLLIFSHGMDQFRNGNTFQLEELASHGYIVAAIDHTYNAAVTVFPDGRSAFSRSQLDDGLPVLDAHMPVWTGDVKFVLDKMEQLNDGVPDGRFRGAIDMKRVGMFGHSYGGATAMQMLLLDDRVKAGIDMDGGLFGRLAPDTGISKPFILMNAQDTEDYYMEATKNQSDVGTDSSEGLWSELLQRRQLALKAGSYSLTIPHTDHMSFTDFALYSPLLQAKDANIRSIHRIINDVSLSFFDKYVKGYDSAALDEIATRYPEIGFVKH